MGRIEASTLLKEWIARKVKGEGCSTCEHLRIERLPADGLGMEVPTGMCTLLQTNADPRIFRIDRDTSNDDYPERVNRESRKCVVRTMLDRSQVLREGYQRRRPS